MISKKSFQNKIKDIKKCELNKIRTYIIKHCFNYINENRSLKLIKNNLMFQRRLDLLKEYNKNYKQIEIELDLRK